jgi:hypothetical protein
MSTRISSAAFALIVAGCGSGGVGADPEDGREAIACALSDAVAFSGVCRVEQLQTEQGVLLVISHPDGGFRRMRVTLDGRGVIAADGAEPARIKILGDDRIEVRLAQDRYRLPATVMQAR